MIAILIILSIAGAINAYFLNWQYRRYMETGTKMFCFLGEDCSKVVGSKYGTHLGLKNEIFGIAYYVTVIIYSIATYYIVFPTYLPVLVFIMGLAATVFSIYLLYLQAYVLKTFCSWCLIAIFINVLIFVAMFLNLR